MKIKILILILLNIGISINAQTLQQAGISETAQNFIRNSGFESQIINDERLQYCLNGIISSDPTPTGAIPITTVNELLNNIAAGTSTSPNTYFVDGNFTLNASQTINIPSNVIIYIRGTIFKTGSHNTIPSGSTNLGPENSVEHIFEINNKSNIKLIGIDNALVESNPAGDEYNRATGFYLRGNSNNIEIRGFHIKNVWEGINCRFNVDRVLIRNNYIQNTNKRAIWVLGANETTAVHNFIENAGWDGFDWDAFAGSRTPDNGTPTSIGAPVALPTGNHGNTGFENFVLGSGRFVGFVEEGAKDNFIVNNIGFMANFQPPNPMRLSFQLGWSDNGSNISFFNESGLKTKDNIFATNAIYRPESYNVEQRAGRVNGGGDYVAKDGGRGNPPSATPVDLKETTYFYNNEAYGNNSNGTPIGKASGDFFKLTVCGDIVPNTPIPPGSNTPSPLDRTNTLKSTFRIGTTTTLTPQGPTTSNPPSGTDCSSAPTGLTFVSSTDTSVTFSFNNTPNDPRTFELRGYLPNTFTGGNVNTGSMGFASASAGSTSITINYPATESGKTFDFAMRSLCSGQTPGTSPAGNIVEDITLVNSTLSITDFEKQIASTTSIYPNPATNKITIKSEFEFNSITAYNILGKIVGNYTSSEFDISQLNAGTYFLLLSEKKSKKVITKQVVKQ